MMTSFSNPTAENKAVSISLKDLIDEIVLRGLRTLNDRNAFRLVFPFDPVKYGINPVIIIIKSRIFQESLR